MTMKAVLGLGGNLGDREQNLAAALDGLEQLPGTQILALSNVYETEPFDVTDSQDNYLNCCALLETALSPEELLDRCLALEVKLGRVRSGRAQEGPMVFAPYLLPHLLALKGEEDGSALFQGREGRTFFHEADRRGAEEAEDSGAAHRE